jgi:hypothetical protein
MWTGILESIHIANAAKVPMQSIASVEAIPGVGLAGDRYALKKGTLYKPLKRSSATTQWSWRRQKLAATSSLAAFLSTIWSAVSFRSAASGFAASACANPAATCNQ